MALKLDCPRCKTPLLAPDKVAGSYAHCPACRGRVWIPHNVPSVPQVVEQVVAASAGVAAAVPPPSAPVKTAAVLPPAAPPGWTPPVPGQAPAVAAVASVPLPASPVAPSAPTTHAPPVGATAAPVATGSALPRTEPAGLAAPTAAATVSATRPPSAPPPAPTPPAAQRGRNMAPTAATASAASAALPSAALPGAAAAVASIPSAISVPPGTSPGVAPSRTARLITSETAQSALKLAPDGRLPELHLDEDEAKKKTDDEQGATMNPLVLFGLLTLSVAMSVAMVLIDWSAPTTSRVEERSRARAVIEEKFFGGGSLNRSKPLEPYQELLRDAQREHFRGNLQKERDLYRRVLDMLRAERAAGDRGLTGSLTNDRLLEKQLLILLSEG